VPKLKGKALKAAKRALAKAHCRVGKVRTKAAKGNKGVVLSQSPRAGARKPAGTKVNLVVRR
jgi:beta-lactam-binding protein with PASTA domain